MLPDSISEPEGHELFVYILCINSLEPKTLKQELKLLQTLWILRHLLPRAEFALLWDFQDYGTVRDHTEVWTLCYHCPSSWCPVFQESGFAVLELGFRDALLELEELSI